MAGVLASSPMAPGERHGRLDALIGERIQAHCDQDRVADRKVFELYSFARWE